VKYTFKYDPRIELDVPFLYVPFEEFSQEEKTEFYSQIQDVTAKIPAKILELDRHYMNKYQELDTRPDDVFEIMYELTELSKKICELNVLFLHLEGRFIQSGEGHY
jgi:hypothetical protein